MSVLILTPEDAQPDDGLDLQYQLEWSQLRSGRAEREIFAYAVISDSGKLYETELFLSDKGDICVFCNCAASEMGGRRCRHVRAVLADVIDRNPELGKSVVEGEENGQKSSKTDDHAN